jgi:hypothetical protein
MRIALLVASVAFTTAAVVASVASVAGLTESVALSTAVGRGVGCVARRVDKQRRREGVYYPRHSLAEKNREVVTAKIASFAKAFGRPGKNANFI